VKGCFASVDHAYEVDGRCCSGKNKPLPGVELYSRSRNGARLSFVILHAYKGVIERLMANSLIDIALALVLTVCLATGVALLPVKYSSVHMAGAWRV
jgi:hypothetical protein